MNNNSIEELNKLMDKYLEAEDFEKVEEVSREICRLQGLKPMDKMPEGFVLRLAGKEKKEMGKFNRILKHTTKAAAVAALVLLAGGTVSAAVMHNNGVNIFKYGLSTGGVEVDTESELEFQNIKFPESPDDTITNKETFEGGSDDKWIEKSVWDEKYSGWSSDDREVWKEYPQANHYTQYKYKDYKTAVMDAGFKMFLKSDYTGEAIYTECEHLEEDEESHSTDYSIIGEYVFGNGKFVLDQNKLEDAETECLLITGGTTQNGREYVSSGGYTFKLADDESLGEKRTTVLAVIGGYELILEFKGMSEDEIHEVLDDIDTSVQ